MAAIATLLTYEAAELATLIGRQIAAAAESDYVMNGAASPNTSMRSTRA